MWHRCCVIVQPQRLRSKMSKVGMWMPPGIHMSSACFYWFISHFCMSVFRKSSWKQLLGWSWGSCGVCWCCPNPVLGAERRTLIHLPVVFTHLSCCRSGFMTLFISITLFAGTSACVIVLYHCVISVLVGYRDSYAPVNWFLTYIKIVWYIWQ